MFAIVLTTCLRFPLLIYIPYLFMINYIQLCSTTTYISYRDEQVVRRKTVQQSRWNFKKKREKTPDEKRVRIISIELLIIAFAFSAIIFLGDLGETYEIYQITEFDNIQEIEENVHSIELDLLEIEAEIEEKIETEIEAEINAPSQLLVRSSQQTLVVRIGETSIYEYQKDEDQYFGEMPPSKWHTINITTEQRNELLTIEYMSTYESFQDTVPRVYYGSGENLVASITEQTFTSCFLSWVAIFVGLLTIAICISYRRGNILYMVHLGIFLVMFGLWSWGESKSLLFHFTNLFLQSQITYILVGLMGIPIFQYVKHNASNHIQKLANLYICGSLGTTTIVAVIVLLRIADLVELIYILQILLAIGAALLLYIIIRKHKDEQKAGTASKRNYLVLIGVGILIVATILEIWNGYNGSLFYMGVFARTGVIIYITCIYIVEIITVSEEIDRTSELKQALETANLHIMTDKMKPHFIHNTLLAIQELCYSDPEQASEAIGIFSRYLRSNFEGTGYTELIPFSKELEYIELYMDIQTMCYEDAIQFDTDIQVTNFKVPPFSIQPLIENAVTHGVRKSRRKGMVELKTWIEHNQIVIEVKDNGVGFTGESTSGEGFSSSHIIRYRIQQLLQGTMEIKSEEQKGTTVRIYLQQKTYR